MSSSDVYLFLFPFRQIWKGSAVCTVLYSFYIYFQGFWIVRKKNNENVYWCSQLGKQLFFTWFHREVWLETCNNGLFSCKPIILFISSIFCKPVILFISGIICSHLRMNIPSPAVSGEILFESARAMEMLFVCTLSSQKWIRSREGADSLLDETESPAFENGHCRCGMCRELSCRN